VLLPPEGEVAASCKFGSQYICLGSNLSLPIPVESEDNFTAAVQGDGRHTIHAYFGAPSFNQNDAPPIVQQVNQ
jgi:hypothetical protein